jgi:hypothetical protein
VELCLPSRSSVTYLRFCSPLWSGLCRVTMPGMRSKIYCYNGTTAHDMDKIHSLNEEILLGIVNLSGRTRSVIESELRERVDMRKSRGGDNDGAYTISLVRKYAEIANALEDEYCDLAVQSDAKTVETPLRNSEEAVVQDMSTVNQRLFKLRMLSGGLAIISLSVMATASHIGHQFKRSPQSLVSAFFRYGEVAVNVFHYHRAPAGGATESCTS